jgi:hypothetical protein
MSETDRRALVGLLAADFENGCRMVCVDPNPAGGAS